jgi:hypothetical protein
MDWKWISLSNEISGRMNTVSSRPLSFITVKYFGHEIKGLIHGVSKKFP